MRAVSHIFSALAVTVVVVAALAYFSGYATQSLQAWTGASSYISDLFSRRSGQLLSLVHYQVSAGGGSTNIKLYLYNYGWADARVAKVYVEGVEASFSLFDVTGDAPVPADAIGAGSVALVNVAVGEELSGSILVTLTTDAGAVYQWKL